MEDALVNLTLTAKFLQVAREAPEKVAILHRVGDAVREFTYREICRTALKVAYWLRREGIKPGDRVALFLENRPEWPISYFGLLLAGAVAVPLDAQYQADILTYILNQTEARVIFTSGQTLLPELHDIASLEKIVLVGADGPSGQKEVGWGEVLNAAETPGSLPPAAPEDLASIIYTSGTTGPPKGVMLAHRNFWANFSGIAGYGYITPEDNFLSILPLHHSFPFMATLVAPLFSGARITYLDTLKAGPILKCIKEQQVTVLALTPQVLQHFYNGFRQRLEQMPLGLGGLLDLGLGLSYRLSPRFGFNPARPLQAKFKAALGPQFRFFISGGAKLPADLARNFFKLGFVVLEGYGLTETSPVVSLNPPEAPKLGSVGRPLPGVEVKILEPDAQGIGEILIKGDNVMPGYYRDAAASREVLRDGWFHSGDLGYLDGDGYIFLQGRLKEIIVLRSGKNVSAEEVSQHYLQAPAIKEIFVMADPQEEKLVALVVPDRDYFLGTGEADLQGRIKWFLDLYSRKLEPYKRVKDFVLLHQELPKTRLGKVKIGEARQLYQQRWAKRFETKIPARREDLSPLGKQIIDLLAKKTGSDKIALEDHLGLDLGLDSLALVELVAALEQRFHIAIKDEEFSRFFTVAELIRYLEEKQPGGAPAPEEKEPSWGDLLGADPPLPLLQRIDLQPGFPARLFTLGCSLLFGLIFKLFFNLKVSGKENLARQNYLICPNHASFLDGFLIFGAAPLSLRYQLFFLGDSIYFELPVIRDLVKLIRVIPIDSARHLVEAMQASAYVLKKGKMLCLFPEGARTISGEVREIKKGVAVLAREVGIRVVPAYIRGSFQAWPPGEPRPKPHPIRIKFGPARSFAELAAQGRQLNPTARDDAAFTLGLRAELQRLQQEMES
ncbi:MAG: AMP-binding protein [Thermodesulfobacteriota bacterium]